MSGSIGYRKDVGRWFVRWWDRKTKKDRKIYYYKGEPMYSPITAKKLLALMQGRVEDGFFRIEEFTGEQPTDTIPYLNMWVAEIADTLKPSTLKDYNNSITNHLIPFFKKHPLSLHEIQHDTLITLLNFIPRSGKGKLNVMYCLHACLDFAWRSRRIPTVPPFPKKQQYNIVKKKPKGLPETRQVAIIDKIPHEDQPIFWWLKYHYRRPGEACAIHKEDFDGEVFTVHRTFSARMLTDRTKTGEVHEIPMVDDFGPWLEKERIKQQKCGLLSPYLFVNPSGRMPGKPYQDHVLRKIWNKACKEAGEDIKLYPGTKHSSCYQFLNEKGGTESELQSVTDHARLESVKNYGQVEVARRKELMERKVVKLAQISPEGVDK